MLQQILIDTTICQFCHIAFPVGNTFNLALHVGQERFGGDFSAAVELLKHVHLGFQSLLGAVYKTCDSIGKISSRLLLSR